MRSPNDCNRSQPSMKATTFSCMRQSCVSSNNTSDTATTTVNTTHIMSEREGHCAPVLDGLTRLASTSLLSRSVAGVAGATSVARGGTASACQQPICRVASARGVSAPTTASDKAQSTTVVTLKLPSVMPPASSCSLVSVSGTTTTTQPQPRRFVLVQASARLLSSSVRRERALLSGSSCCVVSHPPVVMCGSPRRSLLPSTSSSQRSAPTVNSPSVASIRHRRVNCQPAASVSIDARCSSNVASPCVVSVSDSRAARMSPSLASHPSHSSPANSSTRQQTVDTAERPNSIDRLAAAPTDAATQHETTRRSWRHSKPPPSCSNNNNNNNNNKNNRNSISTNLMDNRLTASRCYCCHSDCTLSAVTACCRSRLRLWRHLASCVRTVRSHVATEHVARQLLTPPAVDYPSGGVVVGGDCDSFEANMAQRRRRRLARVHQLHVRQLSAQLQLLKHQQQQHQQQQQRRDQPITDKTARHDEGRVWERRAPHTSTSGVSMQRVGWCSHEENGVMCGGRALPYTGHCTRHVLNNQHQVLFQQCTAKFADNTQCSAPVFDVKHERPLCGEHSRKRDNYEKMIERMRGEVRKRYRVCPTVTSVPSDCGRSSRRQRRMKKPTSAPSIGRNAQLPNGIRSRHACDNDVISGVDAECGSGVDQTPCTTVSSSSCTSCVSESMCIHTTAATANTSAVDVDRSLDLPLDGNEARFLDSEFGDVFNKLPDEAFFDLFSESHTEGLVHKETEELELALEAVEQQQ